MTKWYLRTAHSTGRAAVVDGFDIEDDAIGLSIERYNGIFTVQYLSKTKEPEND